MFECWCCCCCCCCCCSAILLHKHSMSNPPNRRRHVLIVMKTTQVVRVYVSLPQNALFDHMLSTSTCQGSLRPESAPSAIVRTSGEAVWMPIAANWILSIPFVLSIFRISWYPIAFLIDAAPLRRRLHLSWRRRTGHTAMT